MMNNPFRWDRMIGFALQFAGGTLQQQRFRESGKTIYEFVATDLPPPKVERPRWWERLVQDAVVEPLSRDATAANARS